MTRPDIINAEERIIFSSADRETLQEELPVPLEQFHIFTLPGDKNSPVLMVPINGTFTSPAGFLPCQIFSNFCWGRPFRKAHRKKTVISPAVIISILFFCLIFLISGILAHASGSVKTQITAPDKRDPVRHRQTRTDSCSDFPETGLLLENFLENWPVCDRINEISFNERNYTLKAATPDGAHFLTWFAGRKLSREWRVGTIRTSGKGLSYLEEMTLSGNILLKKNITEDNTTDPFIGPPFYFWQTCGIPESPDQAIVSVTDIHIIKSTCRRSGLLLENYTIPADRGEVFAVTLSGTESSLILFLEILSEYSCYSGLRSINLSISADRAYLELKFGLINPLQRTITPN